MPLIRSISGLRATIGDSLLPNIIIDYVSAFAKVMPEGEIVVGRDGRPSGIWIEQIVAGVLAAAGRKVRVLGMVPTPTVQLEVEKSNAAGGIAITASHNPEQWNGLKFLNSEGVFLDADENRLLWEAIENKGFAYSANFTENLIEADEDANSNHINAILENKLLKDNELIESIRSKNFRVVLDAVNASGSIIIPQLLNNMFCEVIELYADASGVFPHVPEPLTENLVDLAEAVPENEADLGIAVDPDADRLVLIDENGKAIGEEKTIALATYAVLLTLDKKNQKVVVNHSTSMFTDFIAKKFGAKVKRSAVGEINVVKKMKEVGAVIGGEGSGGVILPSAHYGRDSLVGIALILALMAETNKTLSELAAEFPDYKMLKFKKSFSGDVNDYLPKVEELFASKEIIREDGLKIILDNAWVQVRASNTEPIIRVISEAENMDYAKELAEKVLNIFE
jgi:phosphomannomutase